MATFTFEWLSKVVAKIFDLHLNLKGSKSYDPIYVETIENGSYELAKTNIFPKLMLKLFVSKPVLKICEIQNHLEGTEYLKTVQDQIYTILSKNVLKNL